MAVRAIVPDYTGEKMDRLENFNGKQVVYFGWDEHRLFCSAKAFPLPPSMPFSAVMAEILPLAFSQHPEFEKIVWEQVSWLLNGEPFVPNMEQSLLEQGIDHKSLIRFKTPGLTGYKGAGV